MEKILEILNDKLWIEGEENNIIGKIETAKKIHEHYMSFVKWKDKKVIQTYKGKYYIAGKAAMKDLTLNELYNYWLTEIKNK